MDIGEIMGKQEELIEFDCIDKEEQIKDILHIFGKIDPKKDKGYLELEDFLKVIINNTNLKEIVKAKPKSEDKQKKYPSHYYINGKNTIEIIMDIVKKNAKTTQEGIYLFNVLKYLIRYRNKNGLDDLKKARNYLDWLMKEMEEQDISTLNE